MTYKAKFIGTCDAMLHARKRGETFGIACGEFSIANKPVLTYAYSPEINHLEILRDRAITYRGRRDLVEWLLQADRNELRKRDWDAYSKEFAPTPVMQRFRHVFLDPASWGRPYAECSIADCAVVSGYAMRRGARKALGKVLRRFK
jgi:hypothetical protein